MIHIIEIEITELDIIVGDGSTTVTNLYIN